MIFEQITDKNRNVINDFIIEQWFTTKMIIRGKEIDMACLYRNALDNSRKLKPEIPLIGENGIPLKHEIEFEMLL